MQVVVKATETQWEELQGCMADTDCIRVTDEGAFKEYAGAAAYFNLESHCIHGDYGILGKPVFIHAVTATLKELNAPSNVLRINGWPGFLQRPLWEIAGRIDEPVKAVFEQLDKRMAVVADEPGLVAARIISMIINEAYYTTGEGVSSRDDIDIAMKLGTNYPFGPFEWANAIGVQHILDLLKKLTVTDKRYKPSPLLESAVNGMPL